MMNRKEQKMLIELICNEQTHMIMKDHTKYESEKYKELEELKVKIKDWENVKINLLCPTKLVCSNNNS